MPRPNPGRTLGVEDLVAARIAEYREARGWSYEGLAERMTQKQCPIHASALYKIEKGSPRRRITVDELVALAAVFEVPLDDLTKPVSTDAVDKVMRLVEDFREAERVLRESVQAVNAARKASADAGTVLAKSSSALRTALKALPSKLRAEVIMAAGLEDPMYPRAWERSTK